MMRGILSIRVNDISKIFKFNPHVLATVYMIINLQLLLANIITRLLYLVALFILPSILLFTEI